MWIPDLVALEEPADIFKITIHLVNHEIES